MPSLVGTKIDKYDVLAEVGHGGMAVVYRGRDTVLDREVAVKVLHAHLADREESKLRLQREALTVAKLRHENILEIFDYSGPDATESYIVTEFIHGLTLKEWMDESHAPRPAIAALIIHRICHALSHAHKTGVIHRDIKPENVMIRRDDGCLKLMDFGIAQILDKQKLTLTGQLLGSPAYMAPELINGQRLDRRTDLFSLGILLYQLAAGALPFSGRNPHEVLNRIADGDYPPPSSISPMVDSDLEAIIARTLTVVPADRYQTAEALASDLEEYLSETGIDASTEEIAGYFADPEAYVDKLDARVSKALLERAEEAAKEGHGARAIRLLGRVLEFEPNNKQAKALLLRLRKRARRTRQLLWAGAMLGGGGLVAAAALLFWPDPNAPGVALAEKIRERSAPPVLAPSPTDEATDEATGISTEPPSTSPRRLAKVVPLRARTTTSKCTIKLEGVPASTAQNLTLKVGDKKQAVTDLTMPIEFKGEEVAVMVDGDRYGGRTRVTRDECKKDAVVPMTITRHPAEVTFIGQPEGFAVTCEKGCPPGTPKNMSAGDFPNIPMSTDELWVTLTYKASRYETRENQREKLVPGPNTLRVTMKEH